jgi:uncharacterized protein
MAEDRVEKQKDKIQVPLIGQLAVRNLLITKEELQKGLTHCSDSKDKASTLKEYFVSNKLISLKNIKRLARAAKAFEFRQKEFRFGSIAIRKGFINKSVLSLALEEQENNLKNKNKVTHIGELLVGAGLLTDQQRDYILKLQKRIRIENQKISKITQHKSGALQGEQADGSSGESSGENSIASPEKTLGGKIVEDTSDKSLLLEPEIITGGIKLDIAKDFMVAFLTKTESFDQNIIVEQIKEALFDKGVVSGIVVDEMIQGFISSSGFKTKAFKVAQGVLPIEGRNARVEFFFNTDYLKAGGMADDGVIDFKDRGEIPLVKEGTVLAEKIPMVQSQNGYNIYGDTVETVPGKDFAIKYGTGVKISEDGVKLLAIVTGFPKYSLAGRIFVHEEYTTQGDVDYETGHINFKGNVDVKGRVKSGFKVKGNDIKAIELDGGIVTAEGNVRIAGGINDGKIYSRGNVYAKFVHNSDIICMGDVIIEKEIVDSDIECSGRCVTGNGKIISSQVTAKLGVKSRHIGTEKAEPSLIKVGHDIFTQKELEKNKNEMESIEEQILQHKKKKAKIEIENKSVQKQITELAHVQDRAQLKEKELNLKISLQEDNLESSNSIQKMKKEIEQLRIDAQAAEHNLDACFDKSEEFEETMKKEVKEIESLDKIRQDFLTERANLIQWAKENPGKAIVVVEGAIMNGTVITGLHSEKRIAEMIRHSKIVEALCTSDGGKNQTVYEMQVNSI